MLIALLLLCAVGYAVIHLVTMQDDPGCEDDLCGVKVPGVNKIDWDNYKPDFRMQDGQCRYCEQYPDEQWRKDNLAREDGCGAMICRELQHAEWKYRADIKKKRGEL